MGTVLWFLKVSSDIGYFKVITMSAGYSWCVSKSGRANRGLNACTFAAGIVQCNLVNLTPLHFLAINSVAFLVDNLNANELVYLVYFSHV